MLKNECRCKSRWPGYTAFAPALTVPSGTPLSRTSVGESTKEEGPESFKISTKYHYISGSKINFFMLAPTGN